MNGLPDDVQLSPTLSTLLDQAQRADRAGQRELARRRYESVLYLLEPGHGSVASAILRWIGRTYLDEGQFDAGLDCLTAAHAVGDALGNRSHVAHAVNLMAMVHHQRSDLETAEVLYREARGVAEQIDDEPLMAMIAQNLGVIANMRGELTSALDHYSASLATYRKLGSDRYVGGVLSNIAMANAHLERWDDARAAYEEALIYCERAGDLANKLMVQVNLADLMITRGEHEAAAALCESVLAEASESGDQRALGEAYKHKGVLARTRGDLAEAELNLAAAYDNAIRREDLLLAAESAREQAELYETQGRNRDTLQTLGLAYRLFGKLRAQRDLADLSRRVGRLEDRFYFVVRRWAETIESKDPYTLGHCERVAQYASALARDAGFDEITMFWFRIGALLHDVGKIAVPSEILNKSGPLSDEERALMEHHVVAGVDLLRDIDFPWDVLPMIRGHHERWDGAGYPDRLAADAIPSAARILCVADVFDALTTDRPYRRGFSREEALRMMRADSGRIFDPELLPRFERVVGSLGLTEAAQRMTV
ncbi:MAG TPA: HD domain-containing phosphohydrolase [Gemmatimonadaceae bacterium]